MGYTKQTWVNNDPSKPIDASRLGHLEDGVFVAAATADSAAGGVTSLNALTSSGRLGEDALNATFVRFVDQNGDPLPPGSITTIHVNTVTGDIDDITFEGV